MWVFVVQQLDLESSLATRRKYSGYLNNNQKMINFINKCEYQDFFDVLSAIYYYCEAHRPPIPKSEFRNLLNGRLVRHYSAYSMDASGEMVEPGSAASEEAIEEARAPLRGTDLSGPDRQFQDAILDFGRAPDPNYEGAVSGALNAAEGVARIALEDPSVTLGDAIRRIREDKELHKALANSISALYGYASDEGGRHGLTDDPKVDRTIAEYCLHHAAATIVFIARLYGLGVVEGTASER